MADTYKIVRHYFKKGSRAIMRGLTLEEAQQHCSDPETSSSTCKNTTTKNAPKEWALGSTDMTRNKLMNYYIDVRFETEADSQQEAADIVTRDMNILFSEHYAHRLGPIKTTPYIIAITSSDAIEDDQTELEDCIEAIDLFDLYKAVRNEIKL